MPGGTAGRAVLVLGVVEVLFWLFEPDDGLSTAVAIRWPT
jgi:hypothetical protein